MQLADLNALVGGHLVGDGQLTVSGICVLSDAKTGWISPVLDASYRPLVDTAPSGSVFVSTIALDVPHIRVTDGKKAMAQIIHALHPTHGTPAQSMPIDVSASIGASTCLQPGVVIGPNCQIGSDCLIHAGVVIREGTIIGDRVIIQPNAVIGADGFGYYQDAGRWIPVPHIGRVILGDDVEIGASTTVDRGALSDTIIGRGTKIDNQCQVAHNNVFGEDCIIAGGVHFAGSVTLGDRVMVGGQAGFHDHISVGSDSIVMARSGVTKSWPDRSIISGFPAQSHKQELAYRARLRKLTRN